MKTLWSVILIGTLLTAITLGSQAIRLSIGGAIYAEDPSILWFGIGVLIIIIIVGKVAETNYHKYEWENDLFYLLFQNILKVLGFVGDGYEKMKSQLRKNINEDKQE